jgi:hypothetical protein
VIRSNKIRKDSVLSGQDAVSLDKYFSTFRKEWRAFIYIGSEFRKEFLKIKVLYQIKGFRRG